MTDKSTLLRAFNSHMSDFLSDIITIYPENTDIVQARTTLDTVKKANPSLVVKAWFKHVYMPYKDVIDSGNISFFFEKDYSQDVQSLANAADIMKMIDKLRGPIKEMDTTNREHCTKYIQNLSKISALYNSM
jgi:hypothetical protein